MARKYINPNRPPAFVAGAALEQARERAAAAAERLQTAEAADPSQPGWDAEYEAATTAARAAERRPARARRVPVGRVTHGHSRSITEQPAPFLTCVSAGPPGAVTSFASRVRPEVR